MRQFEGSGLAAALDHYMKFKNNQAVLGLMSGRKTKKVLIKKLDDAIKAGTAESRMCTLIITEGDSAKSSALAGISSLPGPDIYLQSMTPNCHFFLFCFIIVQK